MAENLGATLRLDRGLPYPGQYVTTRVQRLNRACAGPSSAQTASGKRAEDTRRPWRKVSKDHACALQSNVESSQQVAVYCAALSYPISYVSTSGTAPGIGHRAPERSLARLTRSSCNHAMKFLEEVGPPARKAPGCNCPKIWAVRVSVGRPIGSRIGCGNLISESCPCFSCNERISFETQSWATLDKAPQDERSLISS